MSNRPAIPAELAREILLESGHRCAVCGTPCPVERAHVIPWHKSREHKAEDLICLCANCHERADRENWGEKTLREYKRMPWVLRQYKNVDSAPESAVRLEITIGMDSSERFDDKNQRWLQYAIAAFLEIPPHAVQIVAIEQGSVKVTIELPARIADRFRIAYQGHDPELLRHLEDREEVGLDKWWKERGYNANPFAWSNAADVAEDRVSELSHLWHVDPKTKADLEGLGPTPTLDKVKSPDTSRLVLIFAPGGGGKTFYRRLAAQQIKEEGQLALEIRNIGRHRRFLKNNVTAQGLTVCIYDQVCEHFSISKELSPHEHTRDILRKCDDALERLLLASPGPTRVYVFVDDIDQLFDEQPSGASRNAQALTAIAELCSIVAERGGGEPLALRVFIPQQLMTPLRNRLLELIHRRRIAECAIFWTAAHCQAVIERRLDSRWNGGPNTGTRHISRLLTQDARDEFREWLHNQEGISPGRVVEILYHLADCAYSSGVATEPIGTKLWKQFSTLFGCSCYGAALAAQRRLFG